MGEGRYQEGFTLLEMLVVLVIAGLLFSLVLTRGPLKSEAMTFSDVRLRVFSAMQTARREAVLGGHDVTFRINPRERLIRVVGGARPLVEQMPPSVVLMAPGNRPQDDIVALFSADGTADGPPIVLRLGRFTTRFTFSAVTGRIMVEGS